MNEKIFIVNSPTDGPLIYYNNRGVSLDENIEILKKDIKRKKSILKELKAELKLLESVKR